VDVGASHQFLALGMERATIPYRGYDFPRAVACYSGDRTSARRSDDSQKSNEETRELTRL